MVTIARVDNNRLLRPASNFVLLGSYLCVLAGAALLGDKIEVPKADLRCEVLRRIARTAGAGDADHVGVRDLPPAPQGQGRPPALRFARHRPARAAGRPRGDSGADASIINSVSGFRDVVFKVLRERLPLVLLAQLAVLILSTCVVFIGPGKKR